MLKKMFFFFSHMTKYGSGRSFIYEFEIVCMKKQTNKQTNN